MLVYTAITGNKDRLREFQREDGVTYKAFVDELIPSHTWDVKKIDTLVADPYLNAKYYKIVSHRVTDADVSLWVDGNISLKVSPTGLLRYLDGFDIALFRHNLRDCTYKEAVAVALYGYDGVDRVTKQMERYKNEGFPAEYGLTYNGFILRRDTPKTRELNEFWWNEILNGSRRDQLSFMYSCWKLGIVPNIIDIGDVHVENSVYIRGGHNYESKFTGN